MMVLAIKNKITVITSVLSITIIVTMKRTNNASNVKIIIITVMVTY